MAKGFACVPHASSKRGSNPGFEPVDVCVWRHFGHVASYFIYMFIT